MSTAYAIPPSFTDVFLVKIGVSLPVTWDPAVPVLNHVAARILAYSTASRLRRFTVLPLVIWLALVALAIAFPAEAHATLGWRQPIIYAFGMADSYGVDPANYAYTTDYGSVFDGGSNLIMGTILEIEAALFVLIGATAVWLFTYAMSFGFLPDLIRPIATVIQDMARQIVPAVASIAGVIAALIIAVNLKKNPTRAVSQIVAGVIVSMMAGALLYAPITWAISDKGPMIQGRDLAIAAGANSNASNASTTTTLKKLEGELLTNYVRRPLQAWNFGKVADDTPACAAAYNKGVNSANPDNIKDGIARCGSPDSSTMKAQADNPDAGQVVTGVGMLLGISVLFVYALVTTFLVILEFIRVVGSGVKTLWGSAVGRIPGGPQKSLFQAGVELVYSGVITFGFVTITILTGRIVVEVFRNQPSVFKAMIECLFLNAAAIVAIIKFARSREKNTAAITAGVLESLGDPAPVNSSVNITKEKSGSFLPAAATLAVGIGAGLGASFAGEALATRYPTASEALKRIAPYHNNRLIRGMTRGAYRAHEKQTDERIQNTKASVADVNTKVDTLLKAHGLDQPPAPEAKAPQGASWYAPTANDPAAATGTTSTPPSTRGAGAPTNTAPLPPEAIDPIDPAANATSTQADSSAPSTRTSPTRPFATPLPPEAFGAPAKPASRQDPADEGAASPAPPSPFDQDKNDSTPAPPAPPTLRSDQSPPTGRHRSLPNSREDS
ncbi:hypothetical protein [Mycobacteroides abscessus]|uniref:hypothetical protein n=1 Tax=Mycobacteroides abscessus TaxID=36809 RepID=UPI0009A89A27|nr:hypothetical protein [Mycobacteroides abscessus]SLH38900.1 Uncharacterised protein [Mycobacteroides abscessus subsp. massiliense]